MLFRTVICLGITFDAGGYNIKVGADAKIEKMKFDMGGAAAALGTAAAIASLRPPDVEVHIGHCMQEHCSWSDAPTCCCPKASRQLRCVCELFDASAPTGIK